jgi:outer membrane protein OmpA-like peptidoglycan-associated protein
VLLALATACWSTTASAQVRGTLNRFRASQTPEDDLHLSRATDLGHLRFGAMITADYALNPLVYETVAGDSSSEGFAVVEHQLTTTLGLSLGLFDRVVVFGGLAFVPVMRGDRGPILEALGTPRADGAGLGDAYIGARVRLFGERSDIFALALQAAMTVPTSGVPRDAAYRGDPTVTALPSLIGELRLGGGVYFLMNVGARIRQESSAPLGNLGFGHELTYGLGFVAPLFTDSADERTHLDVLAQIYGDSAFARFGEREGTALEGTLGLRFAHASGFVTTLAAGPGLARGFGSPDLRAVLMVGWASPRELESAPDSESIDRDGDGIGEGDRCPDEAEDIDSFEDEDGCPDADNDADGIPDASDACPLEPETASSRQGADGCPDPILDTDGDGLLDNVDRCVDQAEDRDGFEDEDGCPDADNDADGVIDGADRCPLQAGPIANEGCPDTDRDGDTIVDRIDNCPDEAGTSEFHGCSAAQRVVIEGNTLQIREMVFFRSGRDEILRRSHALLLNVAEVLNAHPEFQLIVVEGHTDSRGDRDRNLALSQRRAELVVRFLVERGGVAAERLQARGVGPDRPLVPDATSREDLARNRRVEFHIESSAQRGAQ